MQRKPKIRLMMIAFVMDATEALVQMIMKRLF